MSFYSFFRNFWLIFTFFLLICQNFFQVSSDWLLLHCHEDKRPNVNTILVISAIIEWVWFRKKESNQDWFENSVLDGQWDISGNFCRFAKCESIAYEIVNVLFRCLFQLRCKEFEIILEINISHFSAEVILFTTFKSRTLKVCHSPFQWLRHWP